jgi:ornithine cyclodeaminase/alanine dehydrogenase-like protein (mu-crystallin family)
LIAARAGTIVCDDVSHCRDHGEFQGLSPDPARVVGLGDLLRSVTPAHSSVLTIVDRTGRLAQDIAVASDIDRKVAV